MYASIHLKAVPARCSSLLQEGRKSLSCLIPMMQAGRHPENTPRAGGIGRTLTRLISDYCHIRLLPLPLPVGAHCRTPGLLYWTVTEGQESVMPDAHVTGGQEL